MTFDKFFQAISYAAVFCGFLALWVSGTFGVVGTGLFVAIMIAAWFLEGSRWQISDRVGTILIVLALPMFYLGWRFQIFSFSASETVLAGILARMILSLSAIKLLQKKGDRDWIFLYLMSFFEVLLAAGLSISALYLASFLVYLLVMICTIIAFEMRKTSASVKRKPKLAADESETTSDAKFTVPVIRLPFAAITIIVFIVVLAVPMFFVLPRVGGAGIGSSQAGLKTSTGFSDTVRLGGIGKIQQSDEVVMRVRLENESPEPGSLYFRGIALDKFDNNSWSKSKKALTEAHPSDGGELIQFEFATGRDRLSVQTVYLEPLDTSVIFALPRTVAIQGNFPILFRDSYGAISFQRNDQRISYKVLSDRSVPRQEKLRADDEAYSSEMSEYLRLPAEYDHRIETLASEVVSGSVGKYEKAVAVESFLRNSFGYTLEQKAGGDEPLSDFLFNVREGHCEYFATAMAIMLRTQGVATRIVNGFHGGEYNSTADITVVRQRNAHAWVEVYFPEERAWVLFDPTPASGDSGFGETGIIGQVVKYIEALETFWIEYFVAYDDQGQASMARTLRRGFVEYQASTVSYLDQIRAIAAEWWAEVRGDKGTTASLVAVGYALGYAVTGALGAVLFVWLYRKVKRLKFWDRVKGRFSSQRRGSIIGFYERMLKILSEKGLVRQPYQTPLEFARAIELPASVKITERYNSVRYGSQDLSSDEAAEIDNWLDELTEIEKRK